MKFIRLLGLGAALLIMPLGPGAFAQKAANEAPVGSGIEKSDFFKPGFAPVRQAGAYDLTIVYFFDYQCPTCRKYHADVSRALKEDQRVRVIYRDTPMLGDRSDAAAYAAIAAKFQGRHDAMHDALMSTSGPLDAAALRAAADRAKVDWERLQRDIKLHKSRIDDLISWNFELATEAGVYGTPAFIVGNALANGALDYAGLKGEISDARRSLTSGHPQAQLPAAADQKPTDKAQPERGSVTAPDARSPVRDPTGPPAMFSQSAADEDRAGEEFNADARDWSGFGWLAAAAGVLSAAAAAFAWRRRRSGTPIDVR